MMASSVSASPSGYGTGPFSGTNDSEGKKNDDITNGDLVDVCIIIKRDETNHASVTTTVINTCGMSAEGNVTMPSRQDTGQHHIATTEVQLLFHDGPFAIARPQCLSLLSELMRYHPIDRGRLVCHSDRLDAG
jgi:hypothetical protein